MGILKGILLLVILTAMVSCGQPAKTGVDNSAAAQPQKDTPTVPVSMKNAYIDPEIENESSVIVTLPNNNQVLVGKDAVPVEKAVLGGRLKESAQNLSPERRFIYLKTAPDVEFKILRQVLEILRRHDLDRLKLIVSQSDKTDANAVFEVKLPAAPPHSDVIIKPNPLYLAARIKNDGQLFLNAEPQNLDGLKKLLREVFRDRAENGIFREGTNEVEQTVFVDPEPNVKYGEIVKIIDALKEAGASPIVFKLDKDISEMDRSPTFE
jgi:biopolymer transport protein ExbD